MSVHPVALWISTLLAAGVLGCETEPPRPTTTSIAKTATTPVETSKTSATAATAAPVATKPLLEIVLVDDDVDPFGDEELKPVPDGLATKIENAPQGPDGMEPRHYLSILRGKATDVQSALAPHDEWWKSTKQKLPPDRRFAFARIYEGDEPTGRKHVGWRTYVLHKEAVVNQSAVAAASAKEDAAGGGWGVTVKLAPQATERFHMVTATNVRRRLAILVQGEVVSAPVIQERIESGVVTFPAAPTASSADEQQREATRLAASLRPRR